MIIKQSILPVGHKARTGRKMTPQFITIHNTGNDTAGADAEGHNKFLLGGDGGATGWHFTVDDKTVIQHIPTNEVAYHAGDGGSGPGNSTSIGIEICENADGNFEKALANAVELIRQLMAEFKIPIDKVVKHQKWTGKYCPRKLITRWEEFIDLVSGIYTVKPGDTMGQIAARFNLGLTELINLNRHVMNPNNVGMGVKLNILRPKPVEPPKAIPAAEPPKPDPLANVPDWARGAVSKAYEKGYINEPLGDITFYRVLVLLDKLGNLK